MGDPAASQYEKFAKQRKMAFLTNSRAEKTGVNPLTRPASRSVIERTNSLQL
jgi:hypothetical protein